MNKKIYTLICLNIISNINASMLKYTPVNASKNSTQQYLGVKISDSIYHDSRGLGNFISQVNKVPEGSKKSRDVWRRKYPFAKVEVKNHYLKFDTPPRMPLDDFIVQKHRSREDLVKPARAIHSTIILPKYRKYIDMYPGIISVSNCYFPDQELDMMVKINSYACAIRRNVLVCPTNDIGSDDAFLNRDFTVYYKNHHYDDNPGKLNFAISHVCNNNERVISFRPWHNVALIILPENALPAESVFPVRLTPSRLFDPDKVNQDLPHMSGMPILDKDGVLLGIYTREGRNIFNRCFSEFLRYGVDRYIKSQLHLMDFLKQSGQYPSMPFNKNNKGK